MSILRPLRAVALLGAGLAVCATTVSPATAAEPNWQAQPTYGTYNLGAGFSPDPYQVSVAAGGNTSATNLRGDMSGCINWGAPDVDLNYSAGGYPLTIGAQSGIDTVLIVYDPNGNWWFNDDAHGSNPAIRLNNPPNGNYNVWVGTYQCGVGTPGATVYFTER